MASIPASLESTTQTVEPTTTLPTRPSTISRMNPWPSARETTSATHPAMSPARTSIGPICTMCSNMKPARLSNVQVEGVVALLRHAWPMTVRARSIVCAVRAELDPRLRVEVVLGDVPFLVEGEEIVLRRTDLDEFRGRRAGGPGPLRIIITEFTDVHQSLPVPDRLRGERYRQAHRPVVRS